MNKNLLLLYIKKLFKPERFLSIVRHYRLYKKYNKHHISIGFDTQINDSKLGDYVWIGDKCRVSKSCIGRHTYMGGGSSVNNTIIGAFCSISFNVKIGLGKHPYNMVSTHPAFYSNTKPFTTFVDKNYVNEYDSIVIGNDVLIGTNATIMFGVKIGDGAIITNNAVVTKDIPPYAIVGGVPAKLIKYRFDKETIVKLQESEWWNWNEQKIKLDLSKFLNVSDFK